MRQILKLDSLFPIVSPMLAACSLTQPNFYEMSEEELVSYNQSVMGPEQVSCVELQTDPPQFRGHRRPRFCRPGRAAKNWSRLLRLTSYWMRHPAKRSCAEVALPALMLTVDYSDGVPA